MRAQRSGATSRPAFAGGGETPRPQYTVHIVDMKHTCRTYQRGDLEQLQQLMQELGYSVDLPELGDNVSVITKNGGAVFVAETGGAVVGSVCAIIDARLAEGVYAEIVSLIVSEKLRGYGIGKELVKKAESWAAERANKVRVRANENRSAAHAFYKNRGYQETKTQKVFIKKM